MNPGSRRDCRYMSTPLTYIIATCVALICSPRLDAGIVSFANLTPLAGPPSGNVHAGTQEPTTLPLIFPEIIGGFVGANGLPVDHDGSVVAVTPATTASVVNPLLVNAVLPAGTRFDSYLFHFDPSANSSPFYGVSGYSRAIFDSRIIGVQLLTQNAAGLQKPSLTPYVGRLEAGDSAVAANGGPTLAYYPGLDVSRGLEEDFLGIGSGGFEVLLQGIALGGEIDQVRILVESVPEPSSVAILAVGLLGMLFSRITRVGTAQHP